MSSTLPRPAMVAVEESSRAPDLVDDSSASTTLGALTAIYVKQRRALASFLRRRTGCEQASQELLNDVWLRIARADRAETPNNPEAFLQRVAANLAGDWIRRRKFRSEFLQPEVDVTQVPEPAPGVEERIQQHEALQFLMQVVEELPPKRREVFVLYRGEGLSVKQVAMRLGISEKTVEHQIAKALLHCRQRLATVGLWP